MLTTRKRVWRFLALCMLVMLTQCSPPLADAPQGTEEWGLAAEHNNVSLLDSIGGSSEQPAWSPDGTQIAFEHMEERFAQGGIFPDSIYLVNRDGTGKHRLSPESVVEKEASCHEPAWAPDSRRLVISCNTDGDFDLYVVDVTTGVWVRLTDYPAGEMDPAWSPDGTRIAFEWLTWSASATETVTSSIYVIGSDGHNLERLTTGSYDIDPAWSPDGRSISFTSSLPDESNSLNSEKGGSLLGSLCIVQADGSSLACRKNVRCQNSGWAPDGSLVACASESAIIALRIADGETVTFLDAGFNGMQGLSWSPDGTKIVFACGPIFHSANDLYILDLAP